MKLRTFFSFIPPYNLKDCHHRNLTIELSRPERSGGVGWSDLLGRFDHLHYMFSKVIWSGEHRHVAGVQGDDVGVRQALNHPVLEPGPHASVVKELDIGRAMAVR